MTLHPQSKSFLDGLAEQNGPGWDELSPTEGRELFSSLNELCGATTAVDRVENRRVGDDVGVRIYWPASKAGERGERPRPGIVYFHGGGWVLGDLDTHDALCRRLANEAATVVVSVDYRRPPETVFPGALEDCYSATKFVANHADDLGVDPARIAVAGDSAGGNLAAAVAMLAKDRGGPELCLQILIYPVLDQRCDSASYAEFADGFGLTKTAMQWFWNQYIGRDGDGATPLASPLLAADLTGLPAAHVMTAQYDVLRDEGEAYVKRLRDAGVPTTHRRYDGMVHGFVHFAALFDTGMDSMGDVATVIRDVLHRGNQATD